MKVKLLLFLFCSLQISLCFGQPKYEFRAAWIATVDNIDWPSKKGLSADSQRVEYTRLLDMHQRNGLNAVIVQIRPATDAMYPSQYEPWSEWLTGTQGKPPTPYYDPLQFMIDEAHKRGMEFTPGAIHIAQNFLCINHLSLLHISRAFIRNGLSLMAPPGTLIRGTNKRRIL
jgi:uncharacterized lipoprotein YddW (UPF0748 family)